MTSPVSGKVVSHPRRTGRRWPPSARRSSMFEVEGEGNEAPTQQRRQDRREAAAAATPAKAAPQRRRPRRSRRSKPSRRTWSKQCKPHASAQRAHAAAACPPPQAERSAQAVAKPASRANPARTAPRASPAVRARAQELGIDLQSCRGSGPDGRITHEDLDAYSSPARRRAPHRLGATRSATAIEPVKVIGLRRKIAEKMQDAKRRIPHFAYVEEVDLTELEELRAHLNATKRNDQPKLTLLPFLMRALVLRAARLPADQRPLRRRQRRRLSPRDRRHRHRHADRQRPDRAGRAPRRSARRLGQRRRSLAPRRRRRATTRRRKEELSGSHHHHHLRSAPSAASSPRR